MPDVPSPERPTEVSRQEDLADKLMSRALFNEGDFARVHEEPDDSEAAFPPGSMLGKFEVIRPLGRGGVGEVYLAKDTLLNRMVALKVLTRASLDDVERFHREAQLSAQLTHPNIVQIYEIGQVDTKHYISMQYIEGLVIDQCPMTVREILREMHDISMAVHFAHLQGVVHRDIKPSNILVDKLGSVYLSDFGIAKHAYGGDRVGGLSSTGMIIGTPCYMSPEQARGDTKATHARTDVYSLGATLYKLLTGTEPFTGNSAFEILQQVVDREVEKPSRLNRSLSPEIDVIILKAMEKDPDRRYPTALEFGEELRRVLEGEPIHAVPAPLSYRVWKRLRKHKLPVALGLLLVLTVGVALLVATILTRRTEDSDRRRQAMKYFHQGEIYTYRLMSQAGTRPASEMVSLAKAARENFDAAYLNDPTLLDALAMKGATEYWLGDFESAEAILQEAELRDNAGQTYRIPLFRARIVLAQWASNRRLLPYLPTSIGPRFFQVSAEGGEPADLKQTALRYLSQADNIIERVKPDIAEVAADQLFIRGMIAMLEGRYSDAADRLEEESKSGLRGLESRYYLGIARYFRQDFQRAQADFGDLARENYRMIETQEALALAWMAGGIQKAATGDDPRADYVQASLAIRHALRAGGDIPRLFLAKASISLAQGLYRVDRGQDPTFDEFGEVLSDCKQIAGRASDLPVLHLMMGTVWRHIGRVKFLKYDFESENPFPAYTEAVQHLSQTLKIDPASDEAAVMRGEVHVELGDLYLSRERPIDAEDQYGLALSDIALALKRNPNHVHALWARSLAERKMRELKPTNADDLRKAFEPCLRDLRQALLWEPNNAILYLALGETYEEIGRQRESLTSDPTAEYGLAIESLDKAVELNPSLADAMARRGFVRVRLSRFPHQDTEKLWGEAFADFDKGLKLNPRNILSLLGVAFLNVCEADAALVNGRPASDKLNSALQALAKAQDTSPNHPDALFYRGIVYFHRKHFSRAKVDFLNCIQVHAGYRRWVEPWVKLIPEDR